MFHPGTNKEKTSKNVSLKVRDDGTILTLAGPDGSISSPFYWSSSDQAYIAKIYVFADVEEKGRGDGDHDISSESKSDEYVRIKIILIPAPPEASFTASTTSGIAPLDVTFTDTSTGDDLATWESDFGDGNTSTDQNPTHNFTVGSYEITLTVTNSSGKTSTDSINITVLPELPYVTIFDPKAGVEWKSDKDRWIKFRSHYLNTNHPIRVQYSCDLGKRWVTCDHGDVGIQYDSKLGYHFTRFKWKMDKKGTKDMSRPQALVRVLDRKTGRVLGVSAPFRTNRASGDRKW